MEWEYAVVLVLIMVFVVHICLNRTYTRRIRRLGMEVVETESDINGGDELDEALTDGVSMLAQARADRTGNTYALVINIICIGGLFVLAVLSHVVKTEPVGWMSLLLLPLPVFILLHHLSNMYGSNVRRRSLWSGLSAQSRWWPSWQR